MERCDQGGVGEVAGGAGGTAHSTPVHCRYNCSQGQYVFFLPFDVGVILFSNLQKTMFSDIRKMLQISKLSDMFADISAGQCVTNITRILTSRRPLVVKRISGRRDRSSLTDEGSKGRNGERRR